MIPESIEKHYFFEFERTDRLNRQAAMTATIAALYFSLLAIDLAALDPKGITGWVSLLLAISSAICAIVFAVKFTSFFGHTYYYVTEPENIAKIHYAAAEYDKLYSDSNQQVEKLQQSLVESYARSASRNREANHHKAGLLLASNQSLFSGVVLAALSYVFRYMAS